MGVLSISCRIVSFCFFIIIVLPFPASGFNSVGHQVVGYIAQDRMSPSTLKKVQALIGNDGDLASIANWADEIRPREPKTAPWHYINIPVRQDVTAADLPKFCPNNDCVVKQIQINRGILADPSKSFDLRTRALKFIVHFVGDLHQPLHCADDDDRGGNEKMIRFQKEKLKLHVLWDSLIEKQTTENSRELATKLSAGITKAKATHWMTGNEKLWATESYLLAKTIVYAGYPAGLQDLTAPDLGKRTSCR